MQIIFSKEIGYCYGVRDAINLVVDTSKASSVQTWGPIIHNPLAIKELEDKHSISYTEDLNALTSSTVAIRAHGVSPDIFSSFEEKGINIIDATCPFVKKTQELAQDLVDDGYFVVILGKKHHPEVLGIEGYVKNNSLIVQTEEDLEKLTKHKKIGIVFQSTITIDDTKDLIPEIAKYASELKIYTTICGVTKTRQKEAKRLAKMVDLMLIIGGENSSNTKKLFDISKKENENSVQINNPDKVSRIDFANVEKIGIVTGTSTPQNIIDDIVIKIKDKASLK